MVPRNRVKLLGRMTRGTIEALRYTSFWLGRFLNDGAP